MLDFRFDDKRLRVVTTISADEDNLPKVENLLNKLKKDLSKNQFYLNNYEKDFKTPELLAHLDADFQGEANSKPRQKMVDLLQKELEIYETRVKKGTLGRATCDNYIYAANLHSIPFFSNYSLDEVTGDILEGFIRKLPFSRKRIELIFRPLRNIFQYAVRKQIISNNPINEIDPNIYLEVCPNSDYVVNPCNQDEVNLILAACKHDTIRNFIQFGFWTGMRIGEIFALQWSDISFDNETISITKAASIKGIIKEPKTKAGIRTLEMTPKAKEALMNQCLITGKENDRVFLSPSGRPWIKTSAFREYWKAALTLAGVDYRNPYQMRHTFISYMLSIGNNPLVLYQMVGHENPKIMFDKYARFIKYKGDRKLLICDPS